MRVFKCNKNISFNYSVQHKTLAKAFLTRIEDRNNFLRSSWAAEVAHPWPPCQLQFIVQGNFSGCLSGWQAQVVWNTQTCILQLQTAESDEAETMSAAAGVRTQVSHANNCVLLYWPPRLGVIQESCACEEQGLALLLQRQTCWRWVWLHLSHSHPSSLCWPWDAFFHLLMC